MNAKKKVAPGKHIAPKLHFIRKSVAIGDDLREDVTVSSFVKRGAVLADFPDYPQQKKKGVLKSPLEPGDNVEFSEDGDALIASMAGYPKARIRKQDDGPDIIAVSVSPLIKISHNKMQASLVLDPAIPGAASLLAEDLEQHIEEEGVVYGIDLQAIQKAREIITNGNNDFEVIPFALGVFPGDAVDASLHFELEIGPLAGYRQKDGTIDFRERKIMVGVRAGQLIATKIPAVKGKTGYNVYGEAIEPKAGKDLSVKVSGEATFIADENKVIASGDGALSIVKNDTIKVSAKTNIQGDVDYTTGNIESQNNTTITGSVLPGFKVDVGGDLQIVGAVNSATVTCGGNSVIKGGITGTTSVIKGDGDIDINFIERGTATSGGVVVIRKQSYYSTVEALSDIRCHPESTIMGGAVIAGGNLTVGTVGAENCEPALLAAGVDPGRYLLYKELQQKLAEEQEEIIQTLQILGRGGRSKKIKKMEEAAAATKHKILTLNLIPGTELHSRIGRGDDREAMDDQDPMYLSGIDIDTIRIEVHDTIYAGTTILVGNRSIVLPHNVYKRRYRLSKNLKRIMAIPL